MTVRLSREEMLRRRRIADGLEPLRTDCTVERTDGVDIDAMLEADLRRRYLELLDTAPRELLAPENLAVKTDCRRVDADGTTCALIDVPPEVRRVFGVKMRGWARAVPVLGSSELERVAALQRNRFTAATAWRPVAVFSEGDSGGNIGPVMVWPLTGLYPEVEEFVAVYDTGDEEYAFDEAALEHLLTPTKN
ncbi:MAG: hypothetical protein K2K22_08860 [Muribaculaceae bacterium]|nr:hypothetical protein [Muribaculaceae bacterium]